MPLPPGSIVEGRYEVLRTVRSGGMGAIYEARDLRLPDAPCALKEMLEDSASPAELIRAKFEEEVRYLSTLHHPGIPRVRDFFCRDSTCYIVMDFIRGQDLEDELKEVMARTGRPPEAEKVVRDALAVLEVLDYLHSQDPPVIHRDIKPANIVREAKSGQVRLVDFGLARHLEGRGGTTQTSIGTLPYCPLEQVQGRAEVRSDLYALGSTMYHLLSGQEPQALEKPPLSQVVPGIDAGLAAIVDRAVALHPEHRFASAPEMRRSLQEWLESRFQGSATTLDPAGSAPASGPSLQAPSPPRARRRGALALVALALLLVSLGAVYVVSRPPGAASPTVPVVFRTLPEGAEIWLRHHTAGGQEWLGELLPGDRYLGLSGQTVQVSPELLRQAAGSRGTFTIVVRLTGYRTEVRPVPLQEFLQVRHWPTGAAPRSLTPLSGGP
ncbi:MAG TPA: serine/threonine-protein kinase [Candidatus Nitrosotenuis sp.]|nr:serine/threonine-protein kinase [Candidatus Nitrosotenuis sp.]